MFQLFLIRHAQSANNAGPESKRSEDPAITPIGLQQSALLAHRFRGQPISHLLTSGFRRALETTRPVAQALDIQPTVWTDLHEVGGCYSGYLPGQLEGRPGLHRSAIEQEFAEFSLPDDLDDGGWWKCRPYEEWDRAKERAASQAARLVREFFGTGAVVACVIHADFKSLLLEQLVGSPVAGGGPYDLVNTGVTHLVYEAATPKLQMLNDVSHLPPELITA